MVITIPSIQWNWNDSMMQLWIGNLAWRRLLNWNVKTVKSSTLRFILFHSKFPPCISNMFPAFSKKKKWKLPNFDQFYRVGMDVMRNWQINAICDEPTFLLCSQWTEGEEKEPFLCFAFKLLLEYVPNSRFQAHVQCSYILQMSRYSMVCMNFK